jgi:1,4-alpha-glucan branching enzyme
LHRIGTFGTLSPMILSMRMFMLLNLLLWLGACSATINPQIPKPVSGGIQFIVSAPKAKTVALAGSFNGWSLTANQMTPVGSDGLWSVVIPLRQGEHTFMYLIDGKTWLVPPLADDYVTDGFGTTNGIVVVR